mmetsp:Transcript_6652/g.12965  ORF Transcript_6652/g.12965 Transcript_6652/m.12965 type:complete len:217 (+) Transcript_6652:1191-1841(+)
MNERTGERRKGSQPCRDSVLIDDKKLKKAYKTLYECTDNNVGALYFLAGRMMDGWVDLINSLLQWLIGVLWFGTTGASSSTIGTFFILGCSSSSTRSNFRTKAKQNNDANHSSSSSSSSSSPPVVYSKVHCQPRASWKLAQIDTDATSKNKEETGTDDNLAVVAALSIRVPLMGDKLRRRYPKKVVRWTVPPSFQEGVNDPERPFWFPLALIQSQK